MKIPQHGQADRIAIASVAGAIQNLAWKLARGEMTLDGCVAELHAITRDPHLLAHGVGDPGKFEPGSLPLQIAEAAGADLGLARQLYDEGHPQGGLKLGRRDELG